MIEPHNREASEIHNTVGQHLLNFYRARIRKNDCFSKFRNFEFRPAAAFNPVTAEIQRFLHFRRVGALAA